MKTVIITLAILLAWTTYQFVEKPIRFGLSRHQNWRRVAPIILVVLLCSVGVLGLVTSKEEGFVERFPDQVRDFANFTYDYNRAYRASTCLLGSQQTEKDFSTDCSGRASGNGDLGRSFSYGEILMQHISTRASRTS